MESHSLFDQAMKLAPNERVEFAQRLFSSIDHEDESIRSAWVGEVKDRMTVYQQNKGKLLDFDEVYGS
jgi:putative addiction module component (TIGR02574 family)